MNRRPGPLIRYPILSAAFAAAWILFCVWVWNNPTSICPALPTPMPTPTTVATAMEPSGPEAQASPTPLPKVCNPVLLRVLPPTSGPTPTPTTDPRSTVERLLADLDLAQPVDGYRILTVQAIGPLDWVETGAATTLVVVPATLPTPAPPAPTTTATPTPTSESVGPASVLPDKENQVIEAVIVRIDPQGANGLIPLLIAVDEANFEQVRHLVGRAVVYPVHQVPASPLVP